MEDASTARRQPFRSFIWHKTLRMNNSKRQVPLAFNINVFSFISPFLHYALSFMLGFILSQLFRLTGFSANPATCRLILHVIFGLTCLPTRALLLSVNAMVVQDEPSELLPVEELIQLTLAFRQALYYLTASFCLQNWSFSVVLLYRFTSYMNWTFVLGLAWLRGLHQMLTGLRGIFVGSLQDTIWKGFPLISPLEVFLLDEEDSYVLWTDVLCTVFDLAMRPFVLLSLLVHRIWTFGRFKWVDQNMGAYCYDDLIEERREIRLLHVEKSRYGKLLCRLIKTELRFAPAYEAISYTWDGQELDRVLIINGRKLAVTANAQQIVYDRASRLRPRWLWIDAICINQSSIAEKSYQVAMMDQIYHVASRVIVWLDDRRVTRWRAMLAFYLLAAAARNVIPDSASENLKRKNLGSVNMWRAFEPLVTHNYWWRVWIVQEIAFAKTVHIVWGGYYISWQQFSEFAINGFLFTPCKAVIGSSMTSSNVNSRKFAGGAMQLARIRRCKASVSGQESMQLADFFSMSLNFRSKDPRDQVFALYCMVAANEQNPIQDISPNYRITVRRLYIQVAKRLLAENADLVMNRAGIGRGSRSFRIPSWVPDWQQERLETGVYLHTHEAPELKDLRYRAGVWEPLQTRALSFQTDEKDNLLISAIPVGSLSVIASKTFPFRAYSQIQQKLCSQDFFYDFLAQLRDFHDSAAALAYTLPGRYLPTGQALPEALWRTLIGDRIVIGLHEQVSPGAVVTDGFPAPLGFHEIYSSWLQYLEEVEAALQSGKSTKGLYSKNAETFMIALESARLEGRFAMTHNGLMMMVPLFAKPGDHICVVPGLAKPVVLRPDSESSDILEQDVFQLVGECFVHGFMQGEALNLKHKLQRYVII